MVIVSWLTSFKINGEVERFTLFKTGQVEYSGYETSYQVYREDRYQSKCTEFFKIRIKSLEVYSSWNLMWIYLAFSRF